MLKFRKLIIKSIRIPDALFYIISLYLYLLNFQMHKMFFKNEKIRCQNFLLSDGRSIYNRLSNYVA